MTIKRYFLFFVLLASGFCAAQAIAAPVDCTNDPCSVSLNGWLIQTDNGEQDLLTFNYNDVDHLWEEEFHIELSEYEGSLPAPGDGGGDVDISDVFDVLSSTQDAATATIETQWAIGRAVYATVTRQLTDASATGATLRETIEFSGFQPGLGFWLIEYTDWDLNDSETDDVASYDPNTYTFTQTSGGTTATVRALAPPDHYGIAGCCGEDPLLVDALVEGPSGVWHLPDNTGPMGPADVRHAFEYHFVYGKPFSLRFEKRISLAVEDAGVTTFNVTKEFSDGRDDEVEVTLRCNGGSQSATTATVTGDDPDGFTYVLEHADGTTDCEITETGGADGFTPEYNDGWGCTWENVNPGDAFECVIFNRADPIPFTVNKAWEIFDNGQNGSAPFEQGTYSVVMRCDGNEIVSCEEVVGEDEAPNAGTPTYDGFLGEWSCELPFSGTDDRQMVAMVDVVSGDADCWAFERNINDSVVNSDRSDCETLDETDDPGVGGAIECTIVNTVFFEGIPTLSRSGLALLALLLLGVGFIGYRRLL